MQTLPAPSGRLPLTVAAADSMRIVVGVTNGPSSLQALRWAGGLAARVHAKLELVNVYLPDPKLLVGVHSAGAAVDFDQLRELLRGIDALMSQLIARASLVPDLEVERHPVADGNLPAALARVSDGATMLVIGTDSRQSNGVVSSALARAVLRQARCPVVVVPPSRVRVVTP
ncbi:MAG: universal stress protein [Actinomycetales bacterium]